MVRNSKEVLKRSVLERSESSVQEEISAHVWSCDVSGAAENVWNPRYMCGVITRVGVQMPVATLSQPRLSISTSRLKPETV